MTFQWYHETAAIPGATNLILSLSNVQTQDGGGYTLMVSNSLGYAVSQRGEVNVLSSPVLETISSSSIVAPGAGFCLHAAAFGAEPLTLQWQLNGVNLTDDGNITGANSPTLCVSSAAFDASGVYTLVLSNSYGCITSVVAQVSVSTVLGWGDNSAGQLNVPIGVKDVRQISAGGEHNLLLQGDGTVLAWGGNDYGQAYVPAPATNIVAVAAGDRHSLALGRDGRLMFWGDNSQGQGNIPLFSSMPVAIAAGANHNLALHSDATVVAWGANTYGQTNVPVSATNVMRLRPAESRAWV